jgi:hypothetical protein
MAKGIFAGLKGVDAFGKVRPAVPVQNARSFDNT